MTTSAPALARVELARDRITVPGDNVRDNGHVDHALADSIAELGLLQPIIVATDDAKTHVLSGGFRRLAAIDHLIADGRWPKTRKIPATVAQAAPGETTERLVAMLVENLLRRDLDPIEEAGGYFRLTELAMTKTELARRVNRSEGHVSGRLQLLALLPELQQAVSDGALPIGKAQEVATIPHTAQVKLLEAAKAGADRKLEDARTELLELYRDADVEKVADVGGEYWLDQGPDDLEYFNTIEAEVAAGRVPLSIDTYEINEVVAQAKRDAGAAALRDEWEAKGFTVIDVREDTKALEIRKEDWAADSWYKDRYLYLGPKGLDTHPNEPCAAVRIDHHATIVEHVCVDPARHDEKGDSALRRPKPKKGSSTGGGTDDRKKVIEANRRAEQKMVDGFALALGGTIKAADALEGFVVATLGAYFKVDEQKKLGPLLGIPKPKYIAEWATVINDYIAESKANRLRAALTLAMIRGGDLVYRNEMSTGDVTDWLDARGYKAK